ncbi:MAG: ribonucleoside triphosphate reductase [Candidatus Ancillula sp.]|nr:ribonucleoside triphosphate reductase [Candidatus Ancillula sp.]
MFFALYLKLIFQLFLGQKIRFEEKYKLKGEKMAEDYTPRGTKVDVSSTIKEYLDRSDWRVNANANQGYSLGGMILNTSGKVVANYWLNDVYGKENPGIGEAHRNGDYHIHDLDMLSGYCAGWSLRRLLEEGLNGVPGKVEARPPKHFSAAIGQIVNFLGCLQNEWAGAQAFSSFDTYMAPYVHLDNLDYKQVKQGIQELIYNLNVPSRWGTQTPFTNLTFDIICPEEIGVQYPIIGGEIADFTYGDLQKEMDMINKAYIEVMTDGDASGRVFTFPIPTYNVTNDFPWDSEVVDALMEMTAKYGLPYFSNFVSSDMDPHQIRSMCCRLRLDLSELLKRGNGLFGSAEQTGSLGVVTINCARLGYTYAGDFPGLLAQLDKLLVLAKQSLEIKREVIQHYLDDGLFPYTKRYLDTLDNHFSTIGVNGVNEMVRNFFVYSKATPEQKRAGIKVGDDLDITTDKGEQLALALLDHVREKMIQFQEETGHMYNLEATPAEGTTYRFAKADRAAFGRSILQAGTDENPYYTNSSQHPVGWTDDPFESLAQQEKLQTKYTGGTVHHLYMGERISSGAACKKIVRRALEKFETPYISITPTFSISPVNGYIAGEHFFDPIYDQQHGLTDESPAEDRVACEVWTRVMGYFRPVTSFNTGKKGEFKERTYFKESSAMNAIDRLDNTQGLKDNKEPLPEGMTSQIQTTQAF